MEDTIVSYETALLAKEVGFNEECNNVYNKSLKKETLEYYEGDASGVIKNSEVQNTSTGVVYLCTAPTQSLLSKWLREIHKIHVSVDFDSYSPDVPKYYAVVKSIGSKNMGERLLDGFTLYSNYEEALEQGLFESLKLIDK